MTEFPISFQLKTGETYGMTTDEYVRWLCLIEAVNIVGDEAEKRGIDTETSDEWLKPLPIERFVKERFHTMKQEVMLSKNIEDKDNEKIFTGAPLRV